MAMSNEILEVRTGPIRVSGYALKLRRVINGVLGKEVKSGKIDSKALNESITEVNRAIYTVLAEKYKVPKQAVTNINLRFRVEDSRVVPVDIEVEVFDKDEILSRNATEDVRKALGLEG